MNEKVKVATIEVYPVEQFLWIAKSQDYLRDLINVLAQLAKMYLYSVQQSNDSFIQHSRGSNCESSKQC